MKEECRDARGVNFIETTIQDIRYGLRQLKRNPGFTAVAVLTLALGIGANTAVFSGVNAMLLRSFPFPNLERVVAVRETAPKLVESPCPPCLWQAAGRVSGQQRIRGDDVP